MIELLSSASNKSGLPPGALIHVGESPLAESVVTVIRYNEQNIEERIVQSIEDIIVSREKGTLAWVNFAGLKNIALLDEIGRHFNIHPLVLEDILNTRQRTKFEDYGEYLFVVLKDLSVKTDTLQVHYEQVAILVLADIVFTFQERADETFDSVRRRLRTTKGRLREEGTDYLTYVLLDIIVDEYFTLQEFLDDRIEAIEDTLLSNPTTQTLTAIQQVKRELVFVRRSVSPLRELLVSIQRSETPLIREKTKIYLRDVYDHAIRIIEAMDSCRDLITGMLDIYLSSVSNKMNEIMKMLTVFASIFIPLTFIAGIYGMNFEYMPELKWKWSYPVLWIFFIIIPAIFLFYFKKKKWL